MAFSPLLYLLEMSALSNRLQADKLQILGM